VRVLPLDQAGRQTASRPTGTGRSATWQPELGHRQATPGTRYAAATAAHSETVLRSFYEFHRTAGTGPILNPFPLVAGRGEDRPNAHHNPMEP
jgi:hypothetical protein